MAKHFYDIYEEGYVVTGGYCGAHYIGKAAGENFIDACKNYIKRNGRGTIRKDANGNEYAGDWGCRWYPTLDDAKKSFG